MSRARKLLAIAKLKSVDVTLDKKGDKGMYVCVIYPV